MFSVVLKSIVGITVQSLVCHQHTWGLVPSLEPIPLRYQRADPLDQFIINHPVI